ncbi:MAG: hypothetical protein HRU34_22935 [Richelia sp.]|nr:hypothetical protein [Richelia sp.]
MKRTTDVPESGGDFTKFLTIFQWFQTLIHPALMERWTTNSKRSIQKRYKIHSNFNILKSEQNNDKN